MLNKSKVPSLFEAIIPIIVLMALIAANVIWIEGDTLAGANQLSLLLASSIAIIIAVKNGVVWDDILKGILHTLNTAMPAIMILLVIGMLSASWMLSGVVPTMIYYGLHILKPEYFLPAAVVLCSIISVAVGSSWSTIATVGVALLGIGSALGFSEAVISGAIVSGAYFGDKISPLSDTTNLAAAVSETPIFTHIRYMMYTTIPSIIITLLIFVLITIFGSVETLEYGVSDIQMAINTNYNISPVLLLVPVITFILIIRKMPAIPVLFIGTILGMVFALIMQQDVIQSISGIKEMNFKTLYITCSKVLYSGTKISTGNIAIDELFATGGMAGMLNTIWLIITAMIFGGVLEAGHFLEKIMYTIRKSVKSVFSLVGSTTATAILFNLTTGDQYISIVIPGKMFAKSYRKQNLAPELLSRTLEDSATVTSVLIPWNTCGATQASILGVATVAYAPYAFFCYISPIMTLIHAAFKIKIRKLNNDEKEQ